MKITATCKYGAKTAPPPFMGEKMDPWTVMLRNGRRRMTVPFYMGIGHGGKEPTAAGVLECLCADAAGIENARDFAEWCAGVGSDPDSRKAEATYRLVERQTRRLRQFLGDDFERIVYGGEDAIKRACAAR